MNDLSFRIWFRREMLWFLLVPILLGFLIKLGAYARHQYVAATIWDRQIEIRK